MKKLIAGALLSSLALMACNPTPAPIIPDSKIRFINASADSQGIRIFIGDTRVNSGSTLFKEAFPSLTEYRTAKAGTLTYSFCLEAILTCPVLAVNNKVVSLTGDTKTSVYLLGTAATTDDTGTDARPLEIVTLSDESTAPAAGKVKLRILHAASAPAAKDVDIYITDPTAAITGIPPTLSYKASTVYRELTAGTWRVRATAPSVTNTTLVDSGTLTLVDGKVYTAMIVNDSVVLLTDK